MSCKQRLSGVTDKYLSRFDDILDDMIEEMTGAELTDSISQNFIVQMMPHHRAAIEMSRNILQYTTLLPLQDIAEGIIAEQTESVENMRDVLPQCGELSDTECDLSAYRKNVCRITQTMFSQMKNACSDNSVNADFMREMIPHHIGAIRMSENALCFPICRQLIPILRAIISSQREGVRKMERLLHSASARYKLRLQTNLLRKFPNSFVYSLKGARQEPPFLFHIFSPQAFSGRDRR